MVWKKREKSSAMTPQESINIQRAGNSVLINAVFFLSQSLLFGVFIYLFAHSTVIFIHRGMRSWASKIMFLTSLVTFLLQGAHWATYTATIYIKLRGFFIEDPSSLGDATHLAAVSLRIFPIDVVENWVGQLTIYISDGIVIWRAWAVCFGDVWLLVVPGVLFLSTLGTGFAYLALMMTPAAFEAIVLSREPTTSMKLVTANLALLFTTNAITTLLIGYKLWTHRNSLGIKALSTSPSSAQKILVVLIESGVAYCALQLVRMVLYCYPGPVQSAQFYASGTVLTLASVTTCMYPTLVIMLVNQQRTLVECFGLDPNSRGAAREGDTEARGGAVTPGHLSFARSVSFSGVGMESVNHELPQRVTKLELPEAGAGAGLTPLFGVGGEVLKMG